MKLFFLHKWAYPNIWMVYSGRSSQNMDENWGYPHFRNPPHGAMSENWPMVLPQVHRFDPCDMLIMLEQSWMSKNTPLKWQQHQQEQLQQQQPQQTRSNGSTSLNVLARTTSKRSPMEVSCACRCFWSRLWRRMPGSRNLVPVIRSDFVSFTNEMEHRDWTNYSQLNRLVIPFFSCP